jgi:hypothetical protein
MRSIKTVGTPRRAPHDLPRMVPDPGIDVEHTEGL